jgi:hypothetical protein
MFNEIFSTLLLITSLAAYVFLFLKLRQGDRAQSELRERVERIVRDVERLGTAAPASGRDDLADVVRQALAAAEDARDGAGVLRRDLADLRAQHTRETATAVEAAAAQRAALEAALAEVRKVVVRQEASFAAEATAAASADENARKRLRMFP